MFNSKLVLIRHGKANYSYIKSDRNFYLWKNFAGLSHLGKKQAKNVAKDPRLLGSQLILTSPYTRSLETAHIIANELKLPVEVEFDLREWEHNVAKQFDSKEFKKMIAEMVRHKGIYDKNCEHKWESLNVLGTRTFNVVKKYFNYNKIIIITHAMVINQFLYKENIKNCEVIVFNFNENSKPNGFSKL